MALCAVTYWNGGSRGASNGGLPRSTQSRRGPEEESKHVTRAVRGAGQKQRPKTSEAVAVEPYQEDEVYYQNQLARVVAELVRPDVRSVDDGSPWGGYTFDK